MHGWSDAQYRKALDCLLADLDEFLGAYAWSEHHDRGLDLHERITLARDYIKRVEAGTTQGMGRPA